MDSRFFGDMRHNNQSDIGETLAQRRRRAGVFKNPGPPPERRSTISSMMPSGSYQMTRMRNLSGGSSGSTASGSSSGSSTQLDNQFPSDYIQLPLDFTKDANASSTVPQFREDSSSPHRKLDRSLSDSDSDRLGNSSHRSVNSSRYKTELCRPFEESGSCKYGDKCQFAHGMHELRNLARHPKYKTELCRTFHTIGFCPYGPRCHFIHGDDTKGEVIPNPKTTSKEKGSMSGSSSPSLSPSGSEDLSYFHSDLKNENCPITNTLSVNINNLNANDDVQSLEHKFSSVLSFNKHTNKTILHDSGSPTFNSNCNNQAPRGNGQMDIFSSVSFFNPNEVLDNAQKQPSSPMSFHKMSKVDNLPAQIWPNSYDVFQSARSMDPFHYSPTGSTGSDSGNISDCSGSMESLASSSEQPPQISNHFAALQSLAGASVWS